MCKNQIVIFLSFVLLPFLSTAQCIESSSLTERLRYLEHSPISKDKQLKELLRYEEMSEKCGYRNDSVRIFLLRRIRKLLVEKSDIDNAILYSLKAVNIVESNRHNPLIDPACQIENFYNLATLYHGLKKTLLKIQAYDRCIAVAKQLKVVNLFSLYAMLEKVKHQNNIGDYDLCVQEAELGDRYCAQYLVATNATKNHTIVTASYSLSFAIEKANALLALQRPGEAETLLMAKIEACTTKNGKDFLGVIDEQLALAKMQQKKYHEALRYFNQAMVHYKALHDTLSYKCIIHNIGFLYDEVSKDEMKALSFYKRALSIKIKDPDRKELDTMSTLNIYSSIGNLYARRLQFDAAQYYFQLAFNLIKKGTNEKEVLQSTLDDFIRNQKVEYLTGLYVNKANAYLKQYDFTKDKNFERLAISMYQMTDRLLERIRANQLATQSKLFWRKITHPFYEQAIGACIKAGASEEAFYFFERSRAVLLYDEMKEQIGFSKVSNMKQQELENTIAELRNQLPAMRSSPARYEKIQRQISGSQDTLNFLLQEIKARNPFYYNNFIDSNFASLVQTQRSVLTHHTLVEIFTGDSCVYSMTVTNREVYFHKIDKAAYDSTIARCLLYVSDFDQVNQEHSYKNFLQDSHHLYNLIFKDNKVPVGSIIFSTDANHFPFEVLVTDVSVNGPVYLIEKHAVSYTYSARFLMNKIPLDHSFSPGGFLGVSPVKFPLQYHLPALYGSDHAIRKIAAIFKSSDTLLWQHATKENFLKKFGRYEVIQLFSHAASYSSRGEPILYFADQPLFLSELGNIKKTATKLVVLSACETGNGKFYPGEGVFSFNRAFAALGVPSCINNLWSVDNQSTYKLSHLFYKNVRNGLPIDAALQLAKIEFIRTSTAKNKMPYFWAAMVLAGKAEPIGVDKDARNLPAILAQLGIGIALLSVLIILIIKRYARRASVDRHQNIKALFKDGQVT